MNYSKAIRTVRAAKGLSQKDLAKLTDLTSSYISRIESGERMPTLEVLEKISKELNIPFYLFTLLASEKEDLKKYPGKETEKVAKDLLEILLTAQKEYHK